MAADRTLESALLIQSEFARGRRSFEPGACADERDTTAQAAPLDLSCGSTEMLPMISRVTEGVFGGTRR